MGLVTALGVTVGFHRLITHRSFETYGWVKFVLAACGAMAVQGSMLQWAALHRRHHLPVSARGRRPHGAGLQPGRPAWRTAGALAAA